MRPEETARMRLEGEGCGGPAESLGAAARRRDHGTMAAMHAVEIADGDDRAGQRRGERLRAVNDGERLRRRLRDFGHRCGSGDDGRLSLIAGESLAGSTRPGAA